MPALGMGGPPGQGKRDLLWGVKQRTTGLWAGRSLSFGKRKTRFSVAEIFVRRVGAGGARRCSCRRGTW